MKFSFRHLLQQMYMKKWAKSGKNGGKISIPNFGHSEGGETGVNIAFLGHFSKSCNYKDLKIIIMHERGFHLFLFLKLFASLSNGIFETPYAALLASEKFDIKLRTMSYWLRHTLRFSHALIVPVASSPWLTHVQLLRTNQRPEYSKQLLGLRHVRTFAQDLLFPDILVII